MKLTREQKIQRILRTLRARPMTRQELSAVTGIALESVCGRCNALLHYGRIEVARSVLFKGTGKYREVLRVKRRVAA